jgi:hypothetical protein
VYGSLGLFLGFICSSTLFCGVGELQESKKSLSESLASDLLIT